MRSSCERENAWLDEAPYLVDIAHVPRGGQRRRKSMEPRALANVNGTLLSTPVRGSRGSSSPKDYADRSSAGSSRSRRRESVEWVRSPVTAPSPDTGLARQTMDVEETMLTPATPHFHIGGIDEDCTFEAETPCAPTP